MANQRLWENACETYQKKGLHLKSIFELIEQILLNRYFPMKDTGMAHKSMKNVYFPNANKMPLLTYYIHLTSVSKDLTQLECLHTAAGNLKSVTTLENS